MSLSAPAGAPSKGLCYTIVLDPKSARGRADARTCGVYFISVMITLMYDSRYRKSSGSKGIVSVSARPSKLPKPSTRPIATCLHVREYT